MKFKSLVLCLLSGLGMALTSCNLDSNNEDNYLTGTYTCCNLVIPAAGDAFATTASYAMQFYYLDNTVSVTTTDLSLGYGSKTFTTAPMPCDTKIYDVNGTNLDVTTFSGGRSVSNGITVQNLEGFTTSIVNILGTNDPLNPAYSFVARIPLVMSYQVDYDYTIKTFMPDAIYKGNTTITDLSGRFEPFMNSGVRYRVIFSTDLKKADIIFYEAKFAEAMPVTINFVIQNLDVTYTKNGYIISGKDLTPSLYEADGLTPAPGYQITSFEFTNTSEDLTVGSARYTVKIGNNQYIGTFQGYYCLSGSDKE